VPYDEDLAARVREVLSGQHFEEMRMFGGLAFLIAGNMAVCVSGKGGLMVRVPPGHTADLLGRVHVDPMVMAGRETRGWILVADAGLKTRRQLAAWVCRGVGYASSLPAK
jgi:hypothetical protein